MLTVFAELVAKMISMVIDLARHVARSLFRRQPHRPEA